MSLFRGQPVSRPNESLPIGPTPSGGVNKMGADGGELGGFCPFTGSDAISWKPCNLFYLKGLISIFPANLAKAYELQNSLSEIFFMTIRP